MGNTYSGTGAAGSNCFNLSAGAGTVAGDTSLNGNPCFTLVAGTNITLTGASPNQITIASAGGGGNTLDEAYDQGGAGAGRSITADSGAVEITGAGTGDMLVVESTDALATAAPDVILYRNSATPAANDVLGRLEFRGKDAGGADAAYATIESTIVDTTAGQEDGNIRFSTLRQGTEAEYLAIGKLTGGNREVVVNDGGADIDTRIEGVGEANALFIQGSDGAVGIGNAAPTQPLDVTGNANVSGSLTLGTDLALTEGGTGASTASAARTNLEIIDGRHTESIPAGPPTTTITINDANVTASNTIVFSLETDSGFIAFDLPWYITARVASTSFTITGSVMNGDGLPHDAFINYTIIG